MIPIIRATAHSFCQQCLQELDTAQEPHEIDSDRNVFKWLSVVVGTTATQRQHPKHLCHTCYAKARTFYEFREKVIVSTEALKEVLKENLHATALDRLQNFCRGCLKRLKFKQPPLTAANTQQLGDWMLDCIGVRMGEHATVKEQQFPTQLCSWCYKQLRSFVKFRKAAKEKTSWIPKKEERAIIEGMFAEQLPVLDTEREIGTETDEDSNGAGNTSWQNGPKECSLLPEINIEIKSDNYNQEQKHLTSNEHPTFELISVQEEDISPVASVASDGTRELSQGPVSSCRKKKLQIIAKEKVKQATNLQGFDHSTLQLNDMKEHVSAASSADDAEHEMPVAKRARRGRKRIPKEENFTKNSKKETIKCAQCDRKFRKKIIYEGHVRRDHEGNDRPFQCTHCPNTYGMHHVMRRHMQKVHAVFSGKAKKAMRLICGICRKPFSCKDHLKDHLRIVHLQAKQN